MTWDEYIDQSARRLGMCGSTAEFKAQLHTIDVFISDKDTPKDFWARLAEAYKTAPKYILKEAAAAAALNALVLSAQALLNARVGSK